jgi:hypothetical protein
VTYSRVIIGRDRGNAGPREFQRKHGCRFTGWEGRIVGGESSIHLKCVTMLIIELQNGAGSTSALTAGRKAIVVKLIKEGIWKCNEAKTAAGRAYQYAIQDDRDASKAERDKSDQIRSKLKTRDSTLEKTKILLSDMRQSDARSWVYDEVKDVYHETRKALDKDWADWAAERRVRLERSQARLDKAQSERNSVADSND